jgi:hypothetical protein
MISHMLISNNFNPYLLNTMLQNILTLYVLHIGNQNSFARTQISLTTAQSGRNM